MKKLFVAVCALCALTLALNAAEDGPKKKGNGPTPEQKALRKEMIEKYDTNKDGKLDKEEKAKMSEEDKAKMKEAGIGAAHGKKPEKKAEPKAE
jgi:hypothetical protein